MKHTVNKNILGNIVSKLAEEYPEWRVTTHVTSDDREVQLIEYADNDGEFTSGLPGEFVSMLSESGGKNESSP